MKKAQGISINTIIIAAIGLLVLVVLIAVFTGRFSLFGIELNKQTGGTSCKDDLQGDWKVECVAPKTQSVAGNFNDLRQGYQCCVDPNAQVPTS